MYCKSCNVQSRHKHQAYCDRNHTKREIHRKKFRNNESGAIDPASIKCDCRFSYPFQLKYKSCVVIEQNISKGQLITRLKIQSKRNDCWLNSHMRCIMEVWGANMDWQLVLDLGLVLNYMSKYVTKSDMSNNLAVHRLIKNIHIPKSFIRFKARGTTLVFLLPGFVSFFVTYNVMALVRCFRLSLRHMIFLMQTSTLLKLNVLRIFLCGRKGVTHHTPGPRSINT